MRKLKTGSKAWLEILKETVLSECPELIECKDCCRVILSGYVCHFCKCNDPGYNIVNPEDYL